MHQRKYALEILKDSGLLGAKPSLIPIEHNHNLSSDKGKDMDDSSKYRRLVGRLICLTITRPDIYYAIHILSQFLANPKLEHVEAALKYIKAAPGQGLILSAKSSLQLKAFSDADWGTCPMTRRSLSGYCVMLGNSSLSWICKKQNTVARSSAEAKYRSMANATCEVTWLLVLLKDFNATSLTPVPLYCDNTSAIHTVENPILH